jgi:uncharacterized protein DUF6632
MNRDRALKIVLGLVGLLFVAGVYFLVSSLWQRNHSEAFAQMMISIYITLGVFLLLAVRNPSAHRSLIAFTAWSSFAHGATMATQALLHVIPRRELVTAPLPFLIIGVLLIALAPRKQVAERTVAVGA